MFYSSSIVATCYCTTVVTVNKDRTGRELKHLTVNRADFSHYHLPFCEPSFPFITTPALPKVIQME